LKKLVGRTDVEDALLRLENVILEETRMAAAEALKGIHVLQDRMRGVEGMLRGVGDMLQGFDERMKDIGQKGINSAQITLNRLSPPFSVSIWPDTEKAEGPRVDESIKINVDHDHDKVHGIQDTVESVQNGTRNVDNEQGIIKGLGAGTVDGAHDTIYQYPSHPERFLFFLRR